MVKNKFILSGIISGIIYFTILALFLYLGYSSYTPTKIKDYSISVNLKDTIIDTNSENLKFIKNLSKSNRRDKIIKDKDIKNSTSAEKRRLKAIRNILTRVKGKRTSVDKKNSSSEINRLLKKSKKNINKLSVYSKNKGISKEYLSKIKGVISYFWKPVNLNANLYAIVKVYISSKGIFRYNVIKTNSNKFSLSVGNYLDSINNKGIFLKYKPKNDVSFNIIFKTKK